MQYTQLIDEDKGAKMKRLGSTWSLLINLSGFAIISS
jgi:hypothetical protein